MAVSAANKKKLGKWIKLAKETTASFSKTVGVGC